MAMRPQQGKRPIFTKEYYVYDPNCTTLGGVAVTEKDGKKVVVLQPAQAQFFVDQGFLGEQPLDQRSEATRKLMGQFLRKPVEPAPQAAPQAAQAKIKKEA